MAGKTATALSVVGTWLGTRRATGPSVLTSATAVTTRFAVGAGAARRAASRAEAVGANSAAALTVGAAGVVSARGAIRDATLAVGADGSATALSVGGAGSAVR